MKQITKFIVIATLLAGMSAASFAQSATAVARAVIITPLTITNNAALDFGNVVGTAAGGTVTVDAIGGRTASVPALISNTGVLPTAASFAVAGNPNSTYAITLPAGVTTLNDGAAHTMTVDTWVSSPITPVPNGALDGTGNQTLTVGATLHVGASQVPGTYTSTAGSGDFTVTVSYN